MSAITDKPLVEVNQLSRDFDISKPWLNRLLERQPKQFLRAADSVSFTINRGETLALVGESGSGKSTIAKMLVGLLAASTGTVEFDGHTISSDAAGHAKTTDQKASQSQTALMPPSSMQSIRRRVQMIFQSPYASLNPRWRVGRIIAEPMAVMGLETDSKNINARVAELLVQVGLAAADARKFPHEFSGGQRQRIAIARALSSNPEFIVCDEPTSALDVSVQAQILNLMRDLQDELGLTYLFISHDLSVVRHMANRVGVLYLGALVEIADSNTLFSAPRHPYTRMLLDAVPDLDMSGKPRNAVTGEIPNPINPPSGCTFHPRCAFANERCTNEAPTAQFYGRDIVACHAVQEQRL